MPRDPAESPTETAAAKAAWPDQALLDEVVRRIVEVARPDRIILFGSAARGETGPDSDLDLLVIKRDVPHRGRLAQEIHLNFFGLGVAVSRTPGCRGSFRADLIVGGFSLLSGC